jgi:hypothetical protein
MYLPANSAMNNARPIPIGARNVPLCFSAASMKLLIFSCFVPKTHYKRTYMVKMSCEVKNISIKTPRSRLVFGLELRVVRTRRGPGNNPETTAAAAIDPTT